MPTTRKKFTFESSEYMTIRSTSGDLWNAQFDDPTEKGINATIEAFRESKSIGKVQYHSEKSHRSITLTNEEATITVEYKRKRDGSSEVAIIKGEDTYRAILGKDGLPMRIEQPDGEHGHEATARKLQPLLRSIDELQTPLSDHFGVAYAAPGGGLTKDECDKDYKSKLKSITGLGIGIATGAAAACLGGPLGCLVGLGIALGGAYHIDGEEEQAQQEHEKCLEDAPNDEAPPPD